uniref:Tyrosine specific protein phosphatases domain-containing protein n=1 Tax=Triticum urartu TaxID=4572 RepID=A0A8R7K3P2_TRIUA
IFSGHALQGNTTYVHCKAGRGRSTTVVLCYLIKYKNMTPEDAWAHTKSIRPRVCLTSTQKEAVALFSKLNLDGGLPFQSSVGAAARPRPNTRKIQPDPSDHPEL